MPALLVVVALALASLLAFPPSARAAGGSPLVAESFSGTSVADSRFVPLGDACLTAAARPSSAPAGASALSYCTRAAQSPAAATPGWLQLNDVSTSRSGGIVFNQALPSSQGIQVTFDQAQYGGSGGDGMSFFLADGSYNLTATGAPGSALGYSNRNSEQGVVGGFLGVGLDWVGNFASDSEAKGAGCVTPAGGAKRNSITLRGPGKKNSAGQWLQGYCSLGTVQLDQTTQSLRSSTSAPRRVQITVSPRAADGSVTVTVKISFDGGATYSTLLNAVPVTGAPDTVKFGFAASTGSATDVHLVREVSVETVDPLTTLSLVAQENTSSANYRTIYRAGDSIPYTFVVTNAGSVPVTGLALTVPQVTGVTCPTTTLAPAGTPGASITCTGAHTVSAADVTSATQLVAYSITASASGDAAGAAVSATGSRTVQLGAPSLSMTKTADRTVGLARGDVVRYTFTVTNTGSIPLAPVTVTDPKLGISAAACASTLAPGATATCSTVGSHTISEADLLAGRTFVNSATAAGTLPSTVTGGTVGASASATVTTVAPVASLSLTKTPSAATGATLGQAITYTFSVRNTGSTTLSAVVVSDPQLAITNAPCVATLAPAATATCSTTGAHTIAEADLLAGSYRNTATASATPPSGSGLTRPTATAQATVATTPATASVSLTETADRVSGLSTGDAVTYTFSVRNSGTTTLSPVTVSDPDLGLVGAACAPTLAPGASVVCTSTATRTITEADVIAGEYRNAAVATGTPPTGSGLAPASATGSVRVTTIAPTASLTLVKSATPATGAEIGQSITYTFTVHNTGNMTLAPVTVADPRLGLSAAACVASLAPGATATCGAGGTHVVTESDILAGSYQNTATVTATPTAASGLAPATAQSVVTATTAAPRTALSVSSRASATTGLRVGQVVTYTFTVTNAGNVTLAPIVVSDARLGISNAACVPSLAPGASATCTTTATHTVTDPDLVAGVFVDSVVATGTPPPASGLAAATGQAQSSITTVGAAAAVGLTKVADRSTGLAAGDIVTYTFTVSNPGTVTLGDVTVEDAAAGYSATLCAAALAPGESVVCASRAQHTVTAADLVAGRFDNTASVTAAPPAGSGLTAPTATAGASVGTVPAVASLVMVKSARSYNTPGIGDVAAFGFSVTNTGTLTLAPVTVSDPRAGLIDAPCVASLAPGETATCASTASFLVVASDVLAGAAANDATAAGTPVSGSLPAARAASSASITTVAPTASLTMVKAATRARVVAGAAVDYTFAVRNTGTLPLSDLTVSDPLVGLHDAPCVAVLAPGASAVCSATASYRTVTAGVLVNHAEVVARTPAGFIVASVSAQADVSVTVDPAATDLAATGADSGRALSIAVLLIAAGLLLLSTRRRRRAR